ncbi:unnamed protein product [Porites lobata]|uniref:Uncharacterized protein n=1 Tax=Porites lobata TaxID=104759 RepID=A0ABN8NUF2_9CNID|nr:unnamed protein product [Porites lobata]
MLKRAEARFEKVAASQNTSILLRPPGRPSFASQTGSSLPVSFHGLTEQTSKQILRSSTAAFNKKLCFFCQSHDDKQDSHVIQTENRRKQLSEFVKNCHNDLYKVYFTSTIEPEDALPRDVHYHRACWMKHVINAMAREDKDTADAQDSEQENKVADHLCNWFPRRKSVRQLLAENVDGIEFIIRKEIQEANTWHFKGTLDIDAQDIVPIKLFTLLKWILSGVVSELKTEQRAEDVIRKSVRLAQQIMYQTKTDRQVRYVPQLDEEGKTFVTSASTHCKFGVGLLAHQQMRSKSLIDVLHELGVFFVCVLTIPISQKTPPTERTHFMQPRWLCSSENVLRIMKLY